MPQKPPAETPSRTVRIVASDALANLLQQAADEAGLSLSSYGRMLLVTELRRRGYEVGASPSEMAAVRGT